MNCKVCKAELSQADLDGGRAVTVLRRHYCLPCSNKLSCPEGPNLGRRVVFLVALAAAALLVLGLWLARGG